MSRLRRGAVMVLLGVLLGLVVSASYVGFAQTRGEPMPLVTALQASAEAAGLSLIVAGVPAADVYLPQTSDDWGDVLRSLAVAFGLEVCELGPKTWLVTDSPHSGAICGGDHESEPVHEPQPDAERTGTAAAALPAPETEPQPEPEAAPGSLVYRLRVLQLDENRAEELGLDWGAGVFDVAGRLVLAGHQVAAGFWPSSGLGEIVRFLETEGVAVRLDDLELRARGGEPVRFQRGGTINVNLVGGGEASIVQRFDYGLTLELVGVIHGEEVALRYSFGDSAPGNVTDPRNVQLSTTSASGVIDLPCGYSTVLAGLGSAREGHQGRGLPVLGEVAALGYVFGTSAYTDSRVSYVVTVDVECRA